MTNKVGPPNSAFSSGLSSPVRERTNDKLEARLIKVEHALDSAGKLGGVSILSGLARAGFGGLQTAGSIAFAILIGPMRIGYCKIRYGKGETLLSKAEWNRSFSYIKHGLANICKGFFEMLQLSTSPMTRLFEYSTERKLLKEAQGAKVRARKAETKKEALLSRVDQGPAAIDDSVLPIGEFQDPYILDGLESFNPNELFIEIPEES